MLLSFVSIVTSYLKKGENITPLTEDSQVQGRDDKIDAFGNGVRVRYRIRPFRLLRAGTHTQAMKGTCVASYVRGRRTYAMASGGYRFGTRCVVVSAVVARELRGGEGHG